MSPLGGAVTMDVDGKGKIWASAPDGVVRFDPVTEKFTDFKSMTPFKNAKGTNSTYGAAGDRDGNGWWAQMAFDTIGKADITTGKTSEVALPSLKDEMARLPPQPKAFYDSFNERHQQQPAAVVGRPAPHGHRQECRRAVGRQFLGCERSPASTPRRCRRRSSRSRIRPISPTTSRSTRTTMCGAICGRRIESSGYDPATSKWTMFDLPVRGTEIRHISLLEHDGKSPR